EALRKGNALRTQVKNLGDEDQVRNWIEEGLVDSGFTSAEREGVDTVEKFISAMAKLAENNVLDAHSSFNFIKIHLLSHFAESIPRFGSLDQFSTEIGEVLHKSPKEAYRRSNKHNFIPQILRWCTRKHNIRMRKLNLMQLTKDGFWRSEIQDVLHLYADSRAKRLAAKAAREGRRGAQKDLQINGLADDKFHAREISKLEKDPDCNLQEEKDSSAAEDFEESSLSPEKQQIRMPLLTPLFSNDSEEGDALHPLFTSSSGGT